METKLIFVLNAIFLWWIGNRVLWDLVRLYEFQVNNDILLTAAVDSCDGNVPWHSHQVIQGLFAYPVRALN